MDEYLDKRYELVKYEDFEKLLAYLGLSYMHRKMALGLRPVLFVSQSKDGITYSINTSCTLYKSQVVFTVGEEFIETKPDGSKVKAFITIEGNKILHRQVEDNGRTLNHVYEFSPDKMVITSSGPGLNPVKRHFKALQ